MFRDQHDESSSRQVCVYHPRGRLQISLDVTHAPRAPDIPRAVAKRTGRLDFFKTADKNQPAERWLWPTVAWPREGFGLYCIDAGEEQVKTDDVRLVQAYDSIRFESKRRIGETLRSASGMWAYDIQHQHKANRTLVGHLVVDDAYHLSWCAIPDVLDAGGYIGLEHGDTLWFLPRTKEIDGEFYVITQPCLSTHPA